MTRLRLLSLLELDEFSVAELAAVTRLAQPRVSTHLARLKEAGLVADRRAGVSVYYRIAAGPDDTPLGALWKTLRTHADDTLLAADAQRANRVRAARTGGGSWADTVAGDMERHYSPGRTWEAVSRALVQLLDLGDTLDIASGDGAMAELLARQAQRLVCVDLSEKVVSAGRERLRRQTHVEFRQGDMHALPVADADFDTVLMLHALTYSERPAAALKEAARVLRPGGILVVATLLKHAHRTVVETFGHRNLGFEIAELRRWLSAAGLEVRQCRRAAEEKRPPHFAVLTALAAKPT